MKLSAWLLFMVWMKGVFLKTLICLSSRAVSADVLARAYCFKKPNFALFWIYTTERKTKVARTFKDRIQLCYYVLVCTYQFLLLFCAYAMIHIIQSISFVSAISTLSSYKHELCITL